MSLKKGGYWSGENVAQKNIQVFSTRSWMCLHILCEFLWHVLQKNLIPCWSSCGTVGEERPAGVSDYPGSSAPSIFLFWRSLSKISAALHLAIWLTRDLIRIKTSSIWGWKYLTFNISENQTEVGLLSAPLGGMIGLCVGGRCGVVGSCRCHPIWIHPGAGIGHSYHLAVTHVYKPKEGA